MTSIDIKSVICGGCNMVALLDDDGLCEFCRRASVDNVVDSAARNAAIKFVWRVFALVFTFVVIVYAMFGD